jgi:hypothetical protein
MLCLKACFFQKLLDKPFRVSIDRFIQRFPNIPPVFVKLIEAAERQRTGEVNEDH